MSKKIIIDRCGHCPYYNLCESICMRFFHKNNELKKVEEENIFCNNIPDWCPLEDENG